MQTLNNIWSDSNLYQRAILWCGWAKVAVHVIFAGALIWSIGLVAEGSEVEGLTMFGIAGMALSVMWWTVMQAILTYIYVRLHEKES